MSTTKQLKVYKGIPTIITARARGYWDDKTMLTFDTAGESKSVSMSVYDGLNCDISDSASGVKILDFANTTLPYKWDYNSKLSTSKYCLAPSGQSYDVAYYKYSNFTVVGSPTIDYETGVVGGFSASDYLRIPNAMLNYNSFEICIKIKLTTFSTGDYPIFSFGDACDLFLEGSTGIICQWNGSVKVSGTTVLSANTDYLVKLIYDGINYKCYVNDNLEYTTSYSLITSDPMRIGCLNSQYFIGSVDLSESYIKLDGVVWWDAKSEYTYDNFTTTGSPTIRADGIVSGFSRYNYISLPKIFNPGASTWEQQIKFTTGSSLSYQYQRLTGAPTDMKSGANIVIQTDKLGIWLTSTNSSWNIYTGDNPSASILQTNTTYWVKLIFDGSKYVLSYSTDGTNFTDVITANSSTAITSTQAMSFGTGSGNYPFYGSIDLSESYINVDGSLWWKGGGQNIESLPGILYDYTDDGSSVTLDCYANGDTSVILTDDASYNGTYLGTVAIPAHSV
jgi:hypothetical protein